MLVLVFNHIPEYYVNLNDWKLKYVQFDAESVGHHQPQPSWLNTYCVTYMIKIGNF